MAILQVRIFVRATEPLPTWVETVLGQVIAVITREFHDHLSWFWFSRYVSFDMNDSGDCVIGQIPDDCKMPIQPEMPPMHRSLRFRFEIADQQEQIFRARLLQLIAESNYATSGILDYDKVLDTGNDRFLGIENRQEGRAARRADLVTDFYYAISRLMIDSLVGQEDGRFRLEQSDDLANNPRGSTFQSLHHLFCNITEVPLDAIVSMQIGSNVYPPGPNQVTFAHPIRF